MVLIRQTFDGMKTDLVFGEVVQDELVPGNGLVGQLHALPSLGDLLTKFQMRADPQIRDVGGLIVEGSEFLDRDIPAADSFLDQVRFGRLTNMSQGAAQSVFNDPVVRLCLPGLKVEIDSILPVPTLSGPGSVLEQFLRPGKLGRYSLEFLFHDMNLARFV
jgi:hypothetical protein